MSPDLGPERGNASPLVRRVAMISVHTSPLDQPGGGDAGGLNVYVTEIARELARRGVDVDIFTRATRSDQPMMVQMAAGVAVRHVLAGPFEGLEKGTLPAQMCAFAREVLRVGAQQPRTHYDVVHSHYWLSGQVGALARDRWGVPLVHTMHTMAQVKNALLAKGDSPEPWERIIGEGQVVAAADVLIANTDEEAKDLINSYDADSSRVEVVHPGVDLSAFAPLPIEESRRSLGLPQDADVLLFVGRIQPLKAPDVLLRAAAILKNQRPESPLVVAVVGGPSGAGRDYPERIAELAADLGIADSVRFIPPVNRSLLAQWYSAATLVCVPSYSESFGLVALEAAASGTPVVAAAVGGLSTAVKHGSSGFLVEGHDPADYAAIMGSILNDRALQDELREGALAQAARFSWQRAADRILEVYADSLRIRSGRP